MKVDNEPAISVPVCSKSVKKWKYVLYKNKTKQNKTKGPKKGGGGGKVSNGGSRNPDLQSLRSTRYPLRQDNWHRPFPHSSQARARKHGSEPRVDKHQTWRTTLRLLQAVAVVYIAACLCVKAPFMTITGTNLTFHFFSLPLEAKVRNRWLLPTERHEHRGGFAVTE